MTIIGSKRPRRVKVPLRLRNAIGALELAGTKLSNIAWNLAHVQQPHTLTAGEVTNMNACWQEWDCAARDVSKLIK